MGFLFFLCLLNSGEIKVIELGFIIFVVCVRFGGRVCTEMCIKYGEWVLKGWFLEG